MTRKRTLFGQLKIGAKFVLPGNTDIITKIDDMKARDMVGQTFAVHPNRAVVPELNATVDDILGSWSNL